MSPGDNEKITIGRFGRNASLSKAKNIENKIIRIWSRPPSKTRSKNQHEFMPCATNGETVFSGGKETPIRDFFESISGQSKKKPIFLTTREAKLSLSVAIDFDIFPTSLEKSFPIFSDIKFCGTLQDRVRILIRKLDTLKSLKIEGKTALGLFVKESQFRVERAIRSKKELDKFFAFLEHDPYQEAFKFTEERSDRAIVALDYNSMYGSCMSGYFPDPRYLKYRDHREQTEEDARKFTGTNLGIYRVIMSGLNSNFFSNFHPFKEKIFGKPFPVKINSTTEIELIATWEELEYYRKFFNKIKIIESITSKRKIPHPLFNTAKKLYKQREIAKSELNFELEKLLKLKIASLHSCTNTKKYTVKFFQTPLETLNYLKENLNFTYPKSLRTIDALLLASSLKIVKFKIEKGKVYAKIINPASADSLHSLSSIVISRARLKLLTLIEQLKKEAGVEICYANADSVHISTTKTDLEKTLEIISRYKSEEMGGVRVQCIADKGYWLEPGRYWLIKDNEVVKFANKTFNHPGSKNPFITATKKIKIHRGEHLSFISERYLSIDKTISLSKKLEENSIDNQNFSRYNLGEVKDLEVASGLEIFRSDELVDPRVRMIKKIATDTVSNDSALRATPKRK